MWAATSLQRLRQGQEPGSPATGNGVVFALMSNYLLVRKTSDTVHPIGNFDSTAQWSGSWPEIIGRFAPLAEIAYRLNRVLDRPHYQRVRRFRKRIEMDSLPGGESGA